MLDNREVRTKKDRYRYGLSACVYAASVALSFALMLCRDYISRALEAAGVRVLVRSLPLGDMMWVATAGNSAADHDPASAGKHSQPQDDDEEEYVCPYIVERKTAADLRASISDARYKEQKYRLAV